MELALETIPFCIVHPDRWQTVLQRDGQSDPDTNLTLPALMQ